MPFQFGSSHIQISPDPAPHGNSPGRTAKPGLPWTKNKHPRTSFGLSPLISQNSLISVAWLEWKQCLDIPFPRGATNAKRTNNRQNAEQCQTFTPSTYNSIFYLLTILFQYGSSSMQISSDPPMMGPLLSMPLESSYPGWLGVILLNWSHDPCFQSRDDLAW